MKVMSGFKEGQGVFLLTGEIVIVKEILVFKDNVLYQVADKLGFVSIYAYDGLCESVPDLVKKLIDLGIDLSEIKNIVNKILK